MIDEIDRSVVPPPLYIQIAKDGIWERAWKVTYPDGAPTALEVQSYLSGREEDVALEVFLRTADGRRSYFGIRHPQSCHLELNRIEFLKTLLKIVFESKKSTFKEISKTAALELFGNKGALFAGDPVITKGAYAQRFQALAHLGLFAFCLFRLKVAQGLGRCQAS